MGCGICLIRNWCCIVCDIVNWLKIDTCMANAFLLSNALCTLSYKWNSMQKFSLQPDQLKLVCHSVVAKQWPTATYCPGG